MNAVGADDDVGLDLAAVGQARHRAAIACFNRDAASAEADVGRLERAAQHVEQVGTVHRDVRRAELLAERASTHARNDPPALPAADDQKIRLRPEGNDCILDAKHTERHQGVGAKVKAGAYFVQCGRLLADDNFSPPPFQRQRRGKSAYAAADDGNSWFARHSSPLPCPRSIWANLSGGPRSPFGNVVPVCWLMRRSKRECDCNTSIDHPVARASMVS